MNTLIVFGAKYLFLIIPLVALWVWWQLLKERRLPFAVQAVCAGALALVLAKVGEHFITSTRPYIAHNLTPLIAASRDNGFPSDHTLLSATLALLVLTVRRPVGAALLILALCVGVSRVLALVHSPIDIVGSFGIAVVGVLLSSVVASRMSPTDKTLQHAEAG
ncbi:phosphatase PAP2 family protein [Armatimonas sp.]|uniref:phosphatase PAP2 family protein n=1 Tax=Armatimonas sp. TaxID=1872638 RepID=UPI003750704F